jgi:hypothetical protein
MTFLANLAEYKNKSFILYSITNYYEAINDFIKNNQIVFNTIQDVVDALKIDNKYHFRVHNNTTYVFFGDLDHYNKDIYVFQEKLKDFLSEKYNITFDKDDFMFTKNNSKEGSYHYSIPKWNLTTEKLKEIHTNFLNTYKDDFSYKVKNKIVNCVDTTIYSEHWFRCPNQSKGSGNDKNQHVIVKGNTEDFIITNIPSNSININNVTFIITKPNDNIQNTQISHKYTVYAIKYTNILENHT